MVKEAPLASSGLLQHAIGAGIRSLVGNAMLRDMDLNARAKRPVQALLKDSVHDLCAREGSSIGLLQVE
jgi:hypothetical protein